VSTPLPLDQGTDRTIRVTGIADDEDIPLDVTGWAVVAQARPTATSSELWAQWSTADGTATATGTEVRLAVPHATSSTWAAWAGRVAEVHIEITEPVPPNRRERFKARIYLDPEGVR